MSESDPLNGRLNEISFPRVLHYLSREGVDGVLQVGPGDGVIRVHVGDRRVRHVAPGEGKGSIGAWLQESGAVDDALARRVRETMSAHSLSFGAAMMHLDVWDPRTFWEKEQAFQLDRLYRCFDMDRGNYHVTTGTGEPPSGVPMDIPLVTAIVRGIRTMSAEEIISREMGDVRNLYLQRGQSLPAAELFPHEQYVLERVSREAEVERLLADSLLPRRHVLRVLFLLLAAGFVTTRPPEETRTRTRETRVAAAGTFHSFDDALKYYNRKYELVFRVLSKEIGPVALSILQKAVSGVEDNLPACLRRAELRAGGGLEEKPVLQAVWYQDFERGIGEFLRGLEEVLYAQIYAVKRHLGVEFEQQILQWLNRTDD